MPFFSDITIPLVITQYNGGDTMKTKIRPFILLLFLCTLLLLGGVLTVLFPAPQFSARENRYLSEMPTLTRGSLLSGEYTKSVDLYLAEHIPTREAMREARTVTELLLGKRVINSVLICPDGRLIQINRENHKTVHKNRRLLEEIKLLSKKEEIPCSICILPEQASLTALLPKDYPAKPSNSDNALQKLLNNPDYWYRTDHHMTTEGAYTLYRHLGKALDYTPYGMEKFTPTIVSKEFLGTSDARVGFPFTKKDSITLYRYQGDLDYTVKKDGVTQALTGFYDLEKLKERDGYGVFLGGNHGLIEITKGESDTRPTLLVIKDSYANALLPFLALHYRLIVADPRYGAPPLSRLLTNADGALVLCGEGTLSTGFLESSKI